MLFAFGWIFNIQIGIKGPGIHFASLAYSSLFVAIISLVLVCLASPKINQEEYIMALPGLVVWSLLWTCHM